MGNHANVLVVDDEAVVCKSCDRILTDAGYKVRTALNGTEALAKIQEERFDVVIVDLKMQDMGGLDVLRSIREGHPNIAVIIITGYPSVDTAKQAIQLGAFDYLPKPFTPERLSLATAEALQSRTYRIEVREPHPFGAEIVLKKRELPLKLYHHKEHAWARVEDDGSVTVGIDDEFQSAIGGVIYVDFPLVGETVKQGEVFARMIPTTRRIVRVYAPVSGKVVEVNSRLDSNAGLVNSDPYGTGWILRVAPSNLDGDLKCLKEFCISRESRPPEGK